MPEITMPRLSDTMEDGVVSAWLKQEGDQVTSGEVLAEIETDKALMELEAYEDGVLEQILVEAGARVPIGEPIAILGDGTATPARTAAGTQPGAAAAPEPAVPPVAAQPTVAPGAPAPNADSAVAGAPAAGRTGDGAVRKKSSPLARKIAQELGVDLAGVTGSGPGGRITRRDVEDAHRAAARPSSTGGSASGSDAVVESKSAGPVTTSGDYDEVPLTTIQQVSAQRLSESMQQAPHIYLTSAIDVTDLMAFRAEVNTTLAAADKGKASVNDLLIKAVAVALRLEPAVNVSFAGTTLHRHRGVHLGVAVATPAGLLVPVIRDADRKSVSEIAAETRDKADRARERKLRADEMTGATFTISNLGMFGIEQFTAVINPPESAILAVGAVRDELRPDGDGVVCRKILRVTLSADHRALDGAVAARFLQQLQQLLEHPLRIVT
uniref:dihydrolipoamide acetyltransferase family protein n=1 Tax=Nocardia donostiensis TaxID=1538463 RepID=UPI001592B603|nr:dihydrolipoamide acetyltransferase family protein [Nocardia donostiensis]